MKGVDQIGSLCFVVDLRSHLCGVIEHRCRGQSEEGVYMIVCLSDWQEGA